MSELATLPNVGKVTVKRLSAIGIETAEQLKEVGSREAFIRLRLLEGDTCLDTLYGLEGAIQGVRWHALSDEDKAGLKEYFRTFK